MSAFKTVLPICLTLLSAAAHAADAADAADSDPAPTRDWKLTLGDYRYAQYSGHDFNLRWHRSDTNAWVGIYTDREFGTQGRAGMDTSIDLAESFQLQPSLQIATLGFVGGSLTIQAGKEWFGLAGIGRTNLRPYFNLNFDPNDAITLGAGHHGNDGSVYTLFVVADDRLHTQQRDWHLNARIPVRDMRATLDLTRKSGLSEAGPIKAWGFTVNWDWPAWFLRVARDPKENFSAQDAWRFAGGVRF
jgi:hypothetical protein